MKNFKTQKGITLIALVITIIVMMILVAVSVTVALRGGLFRTAKQAADDTKEAKRIEQKLDDGKIKVNGEWYNSVNDYLNKNPITTGIELSTPKIELKKKQSEEVTGEQKLEETITASVFGMDKEPEITWEFSPTDQTAIELSSETGKTITVTAKGTEDATVTLTAKCTYEGELKTTTVPVTLEILKPKVAKGYFVEYGVAYKDIYYPDYEYSTINGWRLIDYTYDENTGTYSNVKLISTGIPAKLRYEQVITNNDWWVEEETVADETAPSLSKFRDILGGEEYYTFYTGDGTYYSLYAAAGMYYNFGDIEFVYGTGASYNKGCFKSILVYDGTEEEPTTYDENNTTPKSGNELFKVREDATVRLLTLPELNKLLGRTTGEDDDVDVEMQISITEDAIGLYRLDQLDEVIENYSYSFPSYWLASPAPYTNDYGCCTYRYDGDYNGISNDTYGVRPVICISSNLQLEDTNGDGALEMTVVQ